MNTLPSHVARTLRLLEFLLAGVFAWAALTKLAAPDAFAQDIENYRLLPPLASGVLAVLLPWVEFAAAGALALGRLRQGALLLLLCLCLVFFFALLSAHLRGLDINCGCFGSAPQTDAAPHPLRPALLRALALGLLSGLLLACRSMKAQRFSAAGDWLS